MSTSRVKEFANALATGCIDRVAPFFAPDASIHMQSKAFTINELVEVFHEIQVAMPSLSFHTAIAEVNDQQEAILSGYFTGTHDGGDLRIASPQTPPISSRFLFVALMKLNTESLITHLYGNADLQHLFEQLGVLRNTFIQVETESIDLTNHSVDQPIIEQDIHTDERESLSKLVHQWINWMNERNIDESTNVFHEQLVCHCSKLKPKDREATRAGYQVTLNMPNYSENVMSIIQCGRAIGVHRTFECDNVAKHFVPEAADRAYSSYTSIFRFDENQKCVELWHNMDGVTLQEVMLNAKIGVLPPKIERKSTFPISTEEITTEWLTNTLLTTSQRETGARVTSFDIKPIGDVHGYGGSSALIRDIQYEGSNVESAPKSAFAKFPLPSTNSFRSMLRTGNIYWREVQFYRMIAPSTPGFQVPHAYVIEYDEESDDFVLLLEDMGIHYDVGDQIVGCNLEQALAGIEQLAVLHGTWWSSERLNSPEMAKYENSMDPKIPLLTFKSNLSAFEEHFANKLTPEIMKRMRQLADYPMSLWESLEHPTTMAHADFRLDNMFLRKSGESENTPPVVTIDFQLTNRGTIVVDLLSWLVGNISSEVLLSHGREIMNHYAVNAVKHGAKITAEELNKLYEPVLLLGIALMTSAFAGMTAQIKSGISLEGRLGRLMQSLGDRAFGACKVEEIWSYLDKFVVDHKTDEQLKQSTESKSE